MPETAGWTLVQVEVPGSPPPLYARSMLESTTCCHGTLLLQIRFTASFVKEVPLIFLKLTLLILTLEGD